mmetsp:Transcript_18340/g.31386  ORF Transcript_18340/g.31386 Transcript_18340/m.31386 type:complete len:95 (+) Transcript_18340:353-637(+)
MHLTMLSILCKPSHIDDQLNMFIVARPTAWLVQTTVDMPTPSLATFSQQPTSKAVQSQLWTSQASRIITRSTGHARRHTTNLGMPGSTDRVAWL